MVEYADSEAGLETDDRVAVPDVFKRALGCVKAIYIARGYTDLRMSIDGLNVTLEDMRREQEDESLYLFCGRRADRIKGLYRSDGRSSLILFREDDRRYHWPRQGKGLIRIDSDTFLAVLDGQRISFPLPETDM